MNTYTVIAKRWKHGWELHIDDVEVTQSRTLAGAEQMVRDYVETLLDVDASDAEVVVVPALGGVGPSISDTAAVLGVSRGRVSQLVKTARWLSWVPHAGIGIPEPRTDGGTHLLVAAKN